MINSGIIFISYARADGQPHAERLERELQARGYTTWRDTRGIDPAKDFTAEIERAIKAADMVVTGITPDTERDDSFVRREIQYALVTGKRVIVARFAQIAPPIHIVNNTWIEFWRDWDKGFEHLITVLNTPVENYHTPTLPPEAADPFRPYVQSLYERIVDFLDRAVIRLIDLTTEETPDAVNSPPRQPSMIDLFFTAQGIGEDKPAKRPPFATFAEAFTTYDARVLLLGEPGAGKTITLMAFARDAAARRLSDPNSPLPLLGLISSWDAKNRTPLDDWLAAGVANMNAADVKRKIQQGKALLLLDGLDELGSERPIDPTNPPSDKYDPRQRFIEQLPANNQILITCRVQDYVAMGQKIALKGAVTLFPLDDAQMQTYLADQPELWSAVQADDKLKKILTTPLLLSFFAFAYRDDLDGTERQQLANFSGSPAALRDKIFETYVRERYRHEERKYIARGEKMPFTPDKIYERLGYEATLGIILPELNTKLLIGFPASSKDKDETTKLGDLLITMHLLIEANEYHNYITGYRFLDFEGKPLRFLRFSHALLDDYFAINFLMSHFRLRHAHPNLRAQGAKGLGEMGAVQATPALIGLLNDATIAEVDYDRLSDDIVMDKVCNIAAHALEQIATPEALAAVTEWRAQQAGGCER